MRSIICLRLAVGIAVFVPSVLFCQLGGSPRAFEVASVKPSPPTGMVGYLTYPGGRVRLGHQTLEMLISDAFEVQTFQISGGPSWVRDVKYWYDIDARVPSSSESSKANPPNRGAPMNAEQREMLQTLLADRFQLRFHRETRESSAYFLVKGAKPLRLTEGKGPYSFVVGIKSGVINGDGIRGVNASMSLLASTLSQYLERPVLDETGIDGSFDFRYEYVVDDPHPDIAATIVTSVEEIGLKLKAGKAPMETIVIDQAEKPLPD